MFISTGVGRRDSIRGGGLDVGCAVGAAATGEAMKDVNYGNLQR